jgi:hypothetical protein
MTPQRKAVRSIPLSGSLDLHAAMRKGVSHPLQNALDNGRNFTGDPAGFACKSLIHRPISGPLKRKRLCVFITIATPT